MNKHFSSFLILLLLCFLSTIVFADSKTKTYDYKDFNGVSVGSGMHVTVTQSNNYSISITADERDFKDLVVEKKGNSLNIYYDHSFWGLFGHHSRNNVEIKITMPQLTAMELSGGAVGNIVMDVTG